MDLWIVPTGSLKKEVFRIELVDHPARSLKNKEVFRIGPLKTRRCFGLDSRIGAVWSLKNGEVFQIGP